MGDVGPHTGRSVVTIAGYKGCGYFAMAKEDGRRLVASQPELKLEVKEFSRQKYMEYIGEQLNDKGVKHSTSPAVWMGTPQDGEFIGGASEFSRYIAKEYPAASQADAGGCCVVQ